MAGGIRERVDGERQEVIAILLRPEGVERLDVFPAMNSGTQKLSIDATSGSRPFAAAIMSLALCSSSAGMAEMSTRMSG